MINRKVPGHLLAYSRAFEYIQKITGDLFEQREP